MQTNLETLPEEPVPQPEPEILPEPNPEPVIPDSDDIPPEEQGKPKVN